MVPSISLRWKVFGANSRACSKTHVIQPIVSKSLPRKGEPRGGRKEREEVAAGGPRPLTRFQAERLPVFGRGPEEWVKYKGRLSAVFFKWSLFPSLPDPLPLSRGSPYSRSWLRETGRRLL